MFTCCIEIGANACGSGAAEYIWDAVNRSRHRQDNQDFIAFKILTSGREPGEVLHKAPWGTLIVRKFRKSVHELLQPSY
jgi:hypothetical protein